MEGHICRREGSSNGDEVRTTSSAMAGDEEPFQAGLLLDQPRAGENRAVGVANNLGGQRLRLEIR